MELRESIESINEQLVRDFGNEFNGQPRFRVVWSDDQFEKRWTDYTDEGFQLLSPEVRLLPKYRQTHPHKFILERLVPIIGDTDLTSRISYEPCWTFEDSNGDYLPPRFDACKFIIDSIFAAMNKAGTHAKYRDPSESPGNREAKLKVMEAELFGNETPVGDALAYGMGVTVPSSIRSASSSVNDSETSHIEKIEKVN